MGSTGASVIIRADSSAALGGGHLARCRSLALELQRLGSSVRFLTARLPGSTAASIADNGFLVSWLPAAVQGDASLDARLSLQSLAGSPCQWLVVDHYGLARDWEISLRVGARRILVIDDLADRSHDCDVLLDQNLFRNPAARYANLLPGQAVGLFGPRYCLLSDSFAALHGRAWERRRAAPVVRRLLVFCGSTDPQNLTVRVLDEIAPLCRARNLEVAAVLSSGAPHLETARSCADRLGVTLHVDTPDMAGLLADADVALGAGGTANWERCAVGIPSIVCAVAANQVAVCESLATAGMVRYLGWHAEIQPGAWLRELHALLDDPGERLALGERSLRCVDGLGARRVARELLGEMALQLRPARASDCMDVLAWRNDPGTRRHALEPGSIDPDVHTRWFHAVIASADKALLIAESGATPVAVLRYDCRDGDAVISVYLVPAERGCGWGPALLRAGTLWLQQHRPSVHRVRATILQANTASVSAFQRAGYRRQPDGDYLLELDSG
jgi:UDP-2,4-diacetamido-2,4,6-trideoxy-beta-L-altropyranose hydrolase